MCEKYFSTYHRSVTVYGVLESLPLSTLTPVVSPALRVEVAPGSSEFLLTFPRVLLDSSGLVTDSFSGYAVDGEDTFFVSSVIVPCVDPSAELPWLSVVERLLGPDWSVLRDVCRLTVGLISSSVMAVAL